MSRPEQDPELLRKSAEAAAHAADQAWIHMEAEYAGKIPELMDTLGSEGPYAYTIMPQVMPDGVIKMPIATTREEIEECYKFVRGRSDLLSSEAVVELRGSWYLFTETLNRGRIRATGAEGQSVTYALFPSAAGTGITGELVWAKMPREMLGDPKDPVTPIEGMSGRHHLMLSHDRYIKALQNADVEGILAEMNERVTANVRNYVEDTGALISLTDKDAHRAYYKTLFEKFEVKAVLMLDRVIQDDYVFAELRFTVRNRASGETMAFHTAEFFLPGRDTRFAVRIGSGTTAVAA
jgi:hypothetical protein